jgi:hypothetical protein
MPQEVDVIGQLRRNWNAANARKANGPFVALFDGPGGVDNAVKEVRIIDDCDALRDEVERLYDLGVATEGRAEEAEAFAAQLTKLWQRAIDADILDDAHELGNAIADASWLLNYPPPED